MIIFLFESLIPLRFGKNPCIIGYLFLFILSSQIVYGKINVTLNKLNI